MPRYPRRLTRPQAARWLAYCNEQLLDDHISDERRAILTEKADFYRRALVGSCSECGRPLEDETQPGYKLGIGPECLRKRQLDRADADDREYDRAVAHEMSAR